MLTPKKIHELTVNLTKKHTKQEFGLYPPQRKLINYISKQCEKIYADTSLTGMDQVRELTNLLEGFIRYLNDTNKILVLDVQKILTYIYYPENEAITLNNKDNLLIGSKGATVRKWHDDYFMINRGAIFNRLIDCKNFIYDRPDNVTKLKVSQAEMPQEMKKMYENMLNTLQKAA